MFYIKSLLIIFYVSFVTIIIFMPKMSSLYLYTERQKKKKKLKKRNVWKSDENNDENYNVISNKIFENK